MRVISKGNIEELQCECPNCKAIIGYYPHEAKATSMGFVTDNSFIHKDKHGILVTKSIRCPTCGLIIEVNKKIY